MSQTVKIVLACALVAAAAITLRLAAAADPEPPTSATGDVAPTDAASLADAPEGPAAPGIAAERAPVEVTTTPGSEAAVAPPAAVPVLLVHLVGEAAGDAEVRVSAMTEDGGLERRAREQIGVPGELRVPLDARLLADLDGRAPGSLVVMADHPDLLPATRTVPLAAGGGGPLEVTLELAPAAVIVGQVLGTPAGGRATALAYAIEGGTLVDRPLASAAVSPEGFFRMRFDHEGEVALAVLSAGLRPASARAVVGPGRAFDVGLLELTPGAELAGTVADAGDGSTPVRVELAVRGQLVNVSGIRGPAPERLWWTEAGFEVGRQTVPTGARGAFRVTGLAPELHALKVERPAGAHATWGQSSDALRIRAPASGIVLASDWALLELALALPDDLEGEGMLHVGQPDWTPQGTGLHASLLRRDPVLRVGVRPGVETEARVEFAGYEPVVVRVRAERAGEVLRRSEVLLRPSGSVRLVLSVSGPGLEDGARFLLLDDDGPPGADPRASLYPDGQPRLATLEDGRLVFEAVPGGERRLRLAPGGSANERRAGLLDARLTLDLPWGGEHEETVTLESGGALRVEVRDADGARIAAPVELFDADGQAVPALFTARDPAGSSATSNWSVSDIGWNDVTPNLAFGRYLLRVSAEGQPVVERSVRVQPGATAEVSVTL